jgi:hypothetical protein
MAASVREADRVALRFDFDRGDCLRSESGEARVFPRQRLLRRPENLHECPEAEGYAYAIRLPTNWVLQGDDTSSHVRLDRQSLEVRRCYASFAYQAHSWEKPGIVWRPRWSDSSQPNGRVHHHRLARLAERVSALHRRTVE